MFRRSKIRDSRAVLHPRDVEPASPAGSGRPESSSGGKKSDADAATTSWGLFVEKLRHQMKGGVTRPNLLPWWCIYIGWTLVSVVTAVCSFFTVLYTFNYGVKKSLSWLKSLAFSAAIDIFLDQPFKVVLFAVAAGFVLRKVKDTEWMEGIDNALAVKRTWKKAQKRKLISPYKPNSVLTT